jgi:glycosyl transferase family 25
MGLTDFFARAYVINLPERTDRRRETERMLRRARLDGKPGWVHFFPALRPDLAGPFDGVGSRGCFLSHLAVLRLAQADNLANVLVMEDDLEIDRAFTENADPLLNALGAQKWSMLFLGHRLQLAEQTDGLPFCITHEGIQCAHFYAVNRPALPHLIAFLETVLSRPPGHPDGGPMHYDGALTTFRQQNPGELTIVANPSLGWQRSTRSDIAGRWFDRTPALRSVIEFARFVRRRLNERGGERK